MKLRQKLIMKKLIESNKLVTDLQKTFRVSKKTIQNDIHSINHYLKEIDVEAKISTNKDEIGFDCLNDLESIKEISSLSFNDYYIYKMSSNERFVFILLELLHQQTFITIQKLSDELFVSRGTINSDLVYVKKWCVDNDINFISKKGHGIKIEEDEYLRRKLISSIIRKEEASSDKKGELGHYKNYFRHVDIAKLRNIVIESENHENYYFSDVGFEGLVLHLALAVERNKSGQLKNEIYSHDLVGNLGSQKLYNIVQRIMDRVNIAFDLNLLDAEIQYVVSHLEDTGNRLEDVDYHEFILLQIMLTKFIQEVCADLHMKYSDNASLWNGLISHFNIAWSRLKRKQYSSNPLKKSLIENYPEILESVCFRIKDISGLIGEDTLPLDELSYVVLHFAAAYEKEKERLLAQPLVLIVCSTGEGTSRIIENRINEIFNFQIVGVYSKHLALEYLKEHAVDLVISTVSIQVQYENIVVSPTLKDLEVLKIQKLLLNQGFSSVLRKYVFGEDQKTIEKIIEEVRKHDEESKDNVLIDKIQSLLKGDESKDLEEELMLSDVLKKEYVQLDVSVPSWDEAVRKAGEGLYNAKVVEAKYIEATIENVKEVGPYIVITKGVALPHASNQLGVHKTAISLAVLRDPVCFGNDENDPVKYVFMLATVDSSTHLQALSELVTLLEDEGFYSCMNAAISPQEIVDYIQRFENELERRQ